MGPMSPEVRVVDGMRGVSGRSAVQRLLPQSPQRAFCGNGGYRFWRIVHSARFEASTDGFKADGALAGVFQIAGASTSVVPAGN